MKLPAGPLVICALAGLAGWWGPDLFLKEPEAAVDAAPAISLTAAPQDESAALEALRSMSRARPGSAELSRIAMFLGAVSTDALSGIEEKVKSWPPGVARRFALTVISQRLAPPGNGDDDDPEAAENWYQELEKRMAEGALQRDNGDDDLLRIWVSSDPAAATAAILQMPPGEGRRLAVDTAVASIAVTDPASAIGFALQSGEQCFGYHFAEAWTRLVTGKSPQQTAPSLLARMNRGQRNSLVYNLAGLIDANRGLDDSNNHDPDPHNLFPVSDLSLVADSVLSAGVSGPEFEMFFDKLADESPHVAAQVAFNIQSSLQPTPAQTTALEIIAAVDPEGFSRSASFFAEMRKKPGLEAPPESPVDMESVRNRSAPSTIARLADTGRLPEALQALEQLTDPTARVDGTCHLLPAWLKADPAVALAAMDALPLTALTRGALAA